MPSHPVRFTVKPYKFPSTGERIVLVEGPPHGIIHEPTSIYITVHLRAHGLSPNTMMQKMSAVVMFLNWAQEMDIDVDARLGTCNMFLVEEISALKDRLREHEGRGQRRDQELVSASHYVNRVSAVRDYLIWHLRRVIQRIPAVEEGRIREARYRLEDFHGFMTSDLPKPRIRDREGHSEEVQQIFLDAIIPGSPTNPFKAPYQIRNYCLLLLYHELGTRRAEALKVKGEDLLLHGDKPILQLRGRKDELDDPRNLEPRFKTNDRDLPLGPVLVAAIKAWLADRAKNYPGAKRSPYLFLARSGQPLSMSSVNDMFALLRDRVDGLPEEFTGHHARHNANDRLTKLAKELGWNEATEKRNRNYMFGWSKTSNQGEKYTGRATRDGAAAASLELQKRSVKRGDHR